MMKNTLKGREIPWRKQTKNDVVDSKKVDIKKLPSQHDREAVLGCLSRVLAIMYLYEKDGYVKDEICKSSFSERDSINKNTQKLIQVNSPSVFKSQTAPELSSISYNKIFEDHEKGENASIRKNYQQYTGSIDNASSSSDKANCQNLDANTSALGKNVAVTKPAQNLDKSDSPPRIRSRSSTSLSLTTSEVQNQTLRLSSDEHHGRVRSFQCKFLRLAADLLMVDQHYAKCLESAFDNLRENCMDVEAHRKLVEPYLDRLTDPSAGFKCLSLLMFRFLLVSGEHQRHAKDNKILPEDAYMLIGYDARIRRAFKMLAFFILSFDFQQANMEDANIHISRKFEALEYHVSKLIMKLAKTQGEAGRNEEESGISQIEKQMTGRDQLIRGLKVGGVGLAAGTLFAITGGMAAPAIAAGIASIAGGTAIATVAILTLQSAVAVTTIFGVGGGSLAAVKMMKRTAGLEQFEINNKTHSLYQAQLSRTVCISGWIKDVFDFERPWGVTPDQLTDERELLERFYSVHNPSMVSNVANVLKEFSDKGELWQSLEKKFGSDPDHLLPLCGPRQEISLSGKEREDICMVVKAIGIKNLTVQEKDSDQTITNSWSKMPSRKMFAELSEISIDSVDQQQVEKQAIAWDFQSFYSGELYAVKWETDLLLKINDSLKGMAASLATDATREALKQTVLASLVTAIALPAGVLMACSMIDSDWTLTCERADEAGRELAISLMESKAGHRPVTLVGYSFGARILYACLVELARHQELWEAQQGKQQTRDQRTDTLKRKPSSASYDIHDFEPDSYKREPASIIEDAIIIGCPASLDRQSWLSCRRIVAGRLINCYSPNDLMLRLMFRVQRISTIFRSPCGTVPIKVPGVENFDVSKFAKWHSDYCSAQREILELVGFGQAHTTPRADATTGENVQVADILPDDGIVKTKNDCSTNDDVGIVQSLTVTKP